VPAARGARKAGARSLWKGRYGRWTRRSKRLAGSLARSTSWWRLQMLGALRPPSAGKHSGGSRLIWRLRPYFVGAGNSRALSRCSGGIGCRLHVAPHPNSRSRCLNVRSARTGGRLFRSSIEQSDECSLVDILPLPRRFLLRYLPALTFHLVVVETHSGSSPNRGASQPGGTRARTTREVFPRTNAMV
jgi:hypothetical protein